MYRAALKDDKGKILDEFFFGNDGDGIHNLLSRIQSHGKCSTRAVLESTGNMWMKIHDTLLKKMKQIRNLPIHTQDKDNCTEAKIKSDKLDAIEYYLIYYEQI